MKTKIIFSLFVICLSFSNLKGQNNASFIFTAENYCSYIELDSIRINNISQYRDTVLYFPDTVLTVPLSDGDGFDMTYNRLNISHNYPNPFTEKTSFNVLVPEKGMVNLSVYDLSGRLLYTFKRDFEQGIHEFNFYSGKSGLYVIVASSDVESDELRIVNINNDRYNSKVRIEYNGYLMITPRKYFLYNYGDNLIFTGYARPDNKTERDTIIAVPLNDSVLYTFVYNDDVPGKPLEITGITNICENTEGVVYEVENVEDVIYTWIIPDDWEIVSGEGSNSITVNIGEESGYVEVILSNCCGAGESQSVLVYVQEDLIPDFNQRGPYCVEDTPDTLPLVSVNNILGTWEPPVVDTETPGISTYTFTADNACETIVTMDIAIEEDITPVFNEQLVPYCLGDIPEDLPAQSDNDPPIVGTWSPPVINTYVPDTTTYTFTANNACLSQTTMDIFVEEKIIPVFSQLGPYCTGAIADDLPECSDNDICGTWDPSTITTAVEGTYIYTFTADNACELNVTMTIEVESDVPPVFTQLGPYCIGETPDNLSMCSENGICGAWEPPTINTATSGTETYLFTADYVCGSTYSMDITVTAVPDEPQEGSHIVNIFEIEWVWEPVAGATGYLYNTVNDIETATDNSTNTNYLQTNLICDTEYSLYVWAYNECDTSSVAIYTVFSAEHYSYEIGDTCHAGGIVFYDKGNCNDQWQYLSVAPFDLEVEPGLFGFQWGCHGLTICLTSPEIGTGIKNTEYIITACAEEDYAAKVCGEFEITVESITYDDWFLPSRDEVLLIYNNLHNQPTPIGNFSNSRYWSSTETSGTNAYLINFDNGDVQSGTKWLTRRVRPVRAF